MSLTKPDAAAHRLDAVHRKHRRRHLDRKARGARPVGEILLHVARLQRHRRLALGVDAGVDGVEDAADQDRPPADLDAELLGERLDVVEGEIGPGTGAVEEEFDHGVFLCCLMIRVIPIVIARKRERAQSRSDAGHVCGLMDSSCASRAPHNDGRQSTSSPPSPSHAPEHIPPRLLVERLLHELADRKPGLHLRPRAHLGVPALDVRIIVERKALRLVGHGPGKAGDIGDRIVAGDIGAGLAELRIEHAVEPRRLVAVALDRVGIFSAA